MAENEISKPLTGAVIGIGLIGGSMSLVLKQSRLVGKIVGFDTNKAFVAEALALGLVDEAYIMGEDENGYLKEDKVDFIIIATPINVAEKLAVQLLTDNKKAVIFDVGSTKESICNSVDGHENRGQFVATHPMWGTEYSGPSAATAKAFRDKATVICNKEESNQDALALVDAIYKALDMYLVYMSAADHDVHVAYVSHISHITSFALANTVLEKEKEENTIFELASGGFESTVRLAKSNPAMWVPIFMQNKENVLDVLNEHIAQLRKFKACLEKENYVYLEELIQNANTIQRIIK